MIYQFTQHSNLPANSPMPLNLNFKLYGKLFNGQKLTREEKDRVAEILYGLFGANSFVYKYGGFAADFRKYCKRFIVRQYGDFCEYYALDKTSLRKAIPGTIEEIIEA